MGFINSINPKVIDTLGADKLGFYGATPVVQQTIPAELSPSASLGDVIAYVGVESNSLIDVGLVKR